MLTVYVDGEVMGYLLILQHRDGGTLSKVVQRLLDAAEPQLKLDIELPVERKRP